MPAVNESMSDKEGDECCFFSSRRRHTRCLSDWSSDVCSSDLVDRLATRVFPAETVRRWKVMPYRVEPGRLLAVTAEVPSPQMALALAGHSTLEIRYRLVLPREFEELAREYLPAG